MDDEASIGRAFTGLVVSSLAVESDVEDGVVDCAACAEAGRSAELTAGDRVTAVATNYENHSWELVGIRCADHAIASVGEAMPIRAEEQVVVAAVLERAGYRSPDGAYYPDALTLGAIEVVDYSPTAEGYD